MSGFEAWVRDGGLTWIALAVALCVAFGAALLGTPVGCV